MNRLTIRQYIFTRAIIVAGLIIVIIPLTWIFFISFKRPNEIFESVLFFFPKHFTLENYPGAIEYAKKALEISYQKMFLNSSIVTTGGLILAIIAASFAAFGLANFKFKTKELYYTFILVSYMIPVQVLLIPLYLVLNRMGLLNSYFALIFPYSIIGIPVATIILRRFFEQIPKEIKEAAFIDGANNFQIYKNIYLPLAKPALATCIIFLFLEMWNEFVFAFIFVREEEMQTLPLAMSRIGLGGKFPIPWGVYSASIIISVIPILIVFILLQKWFTKGILAGSVKG